MTERTFPRALDRASVPSSLGLPILASLAGILVLTAAAVAGTAQTSPVSTELFRYRCESSISMEDVTLFGNGTLRLRQGKPEQRSMLLLELTPSRRDDIIARLRKLDLEEATTFGGELEGDWVEQCSLTMDLEGRRRARFQFHRLDILSLSLQRSVDLGRELIALVRKEALFEGLPRGYEPRLGDYLRRWDGEVFEVVGFTAKGNGIEVHSTSQPMGFYIANQDLRSVFVGVEEEPP